MNDVDDMIEQWIDSLPNDEVDKRIEKLIKKYEENIDYGKYRRERIENYRKCGMIDKCFIDLIKEIIDECYGEQNNIPCIIKDRARELFELKEDIEYCSYPTDEHKQGKMYIATYKYDDTINSGMRLNLEKEIFSKEDLTTQVTLFPSFEKKYKPIMDEYIHERRNAESCVALVEIKGAYKTRKRIEREKEELENSIREQKKRLRETEKQLREIDSL